MKQKFILAIETSTEHLGVAVVSLDGKCLAEHNEVAYRNLSDNLHPAVDAVMTAAGIPYEALKLIAVTKGPGSFTSIRVGLSAAKGFAFALDIPIVSLTSFEALAYTYSEVGKKLSVWVEAHGGKIYTQNFKEGKVISEALFTPSNKASKTLEEGDILIGNGVLKHQDDIPKGVIYKQSWAYVSPISLAKLALERFNQNTSDVNNTKPLYIQKLNYHKTYNKDGTKI